MFMRRRWAALLAGLGLVVALGVAVPASAQPEPESAPEPAASAGTAPTQKAPSAVPHAVKMRRLFTRGLVCALFLVMGAAAAGGAVAQSKQKGKS